MIRFISAVPVVTKQISCCLLICLINFNAIGQKSSGIDLHKQLFIKHTPVRFDSLLSIITKQTDIGFAVNTSKLDPLKFIHLKTGYITLDDALKQIKLQSSVYYVTFGNHIIFTDKEKLNLYKNNPTVSIPVNLTKKNKEPVKPFKHITRNASSTKIILQPFPVRSYEIVFAEKIKTDSLNLVKSIITKPVQTNKRLLQTVNIITNVSNNTYTNKKETSTGKKFASATYADLRHLYFDAGISGDDIFSAGIFSKIGLDYFHSIIGYQISSSFDAFTYGLGSSFNLNDHSSIELAVTALSTKKIYNDSLRLNNKLYNVALTYGLKIFHRIGFKAGPDFHYLKSGYYKNDVLTEPGIPEDLFNKLYNIIKPLYTISNSFKSNSPVAVKTWIGVQVGVFFELN